MRDGAPVVLIASVSPYEARRIERSLKKTGWNLLRAQDAQEAARELAAAGPRPTVLVIDAGLLEMAHDPQWRDLRLNHPELGAVVRCVVPPAQRPRRRDRKTILVPPGDVEGTCRAVRTLGGAPFAPS